MPALSDRIRSLPADTRAALAFFSRLPVTAPEAAFTLARAGGAWPLAGGLLAIAPAVVLALAVGLWLPPLIAALLALAAGAALTGGMHEDGLSDTADGFGGGRSREAKLAIMRDSRLGTFGALALILVLLLKAAALAALAPSTGAAALAIVAVAVLSRSLALWHWAGTGAARPDGLAASGGQPDAASLQIGALAGRSPRWFCWRRSAGRRCWR